MARILFLTQVLPYPLDAGPKIRAYYVLRHLAQQHEITLVSFVRPDDRPEAVAHLETFCRAVHTVPMQRSLLRNARAALISGVSGRPIIVARDEIGALQALLRRLVAGQPFDFIHADQVSMAQYALYAQRHHHRAHPHAAAKTFLDAHNALYLIPTRMADYVHNPFKRALYRREARALARYEAHTYPLFDHVTFVSDEDRQAILAVMDGARAEWLTANSTLIPICVDPAERALVARAPAPRSVLHLGTMFWPPNVDGVVWFAERAFPRVLEHAPEATFTIVGKNPPPVVESLPQRVRNIHVTGYVPEPDPYLQQAAAFIVPLHAGGGMRVKIVDAWGWGLPIVSTTIGAEGIEVRDGENILLADTPEDFAAAVIHLLKEPEAGERLRANGRAWVEQRYNWRRIYPAWDQIYRTLIHAENADQTRIK